MNMYKCPIWDPHCSHFCHSEGDYGLCLMPQEGYSPVAECEAFDGIDPEDFVM